MSAATFASVLCADWVGLCSDLGADKVNLSTSFQQLRGMSTYPVAEPFAALLEQQVLGSIVAYGVVKGSLKIRLWCHLFGLRHLVFQEVLERAHVGAKAILMAICFILPLAFSRAIASVVPNSFQSHKN